MGLDLWYDVVIQELVAAASEPIEETEPSAAVEDGGEDEPDE